MFGSISGSCWQNCCLQDLNQFSAVLFMSFEHDSEALSEGNLEFLFSLILLLKDLEVFLIELILIGNAICVFLLVFSVLFDSVF